MSYPRSSMTFRSWPKRIFLVFRIMLNLPRYLGKNLQFALSYVVDSRLGEFVDDRNSQGKCLSASFRLQGRVGGKVLLHVEPIRLLLLCIVKDEEDRHQLIHP